MAFLCSVNYSLTVILQEVVVFLCVYMFVVVVFVCLYFFPRANLFFVLLFSLCPWRVTIGMNTEILCLSLSL